jgi:hypothetical protein
MATTKQKVLRTAVFSSLFAILAFGGWIGFRYLETKDQEAACDCGDDPMDGERFGLWSPFRDKESEKAAAGVLEAFQAGHCESIPAARQYCEREKRFRVVSWKLTGRSSDSDGVSFRYWVIRTAGGNEGFGDNVEVTVQRDGKAWKVADVSLYY